MRTLLVVLVMAVSACAGATPGTTRNMDELTWEEIQGSDYANALDIVRNMRPRWLHLRGANSLNSPNPIMVYVDGTRVGGPDELSTIPKLSIERMRFYSPVDAQARWGLNNTNGAIEVITRRS